jgi:hypothetical protein
MVRVSFPGPNGPDQWSLLVADKSAPIWAAASQIMASEPYLFRESAGGTYNCRPPSLHAYGLAIDLNPSKNPYDCPIVTDMPDSFIARMEGIRANGKQALQWGGRWACENPPDPMHYQINVAPSDCKNVTWDQNGDDMALTEKEENTVRDLLAALENNGAGTQASRQAYLDKMVKIGKNYPPEPSSGSGGLQRGDQVTLT